MYTLVVTPGKVLKTVKIEKFLSLCKISPIVAVWAATIKMQKLYLNETSKTTVWNLNCLFPYIPDSLKVRQ